MPKEHLWKILEIFNGDPTHFDPTVFPLSRKILHGQMPLANTPRNGRSGNWTSCLGGRYIYHSTKYSHMWCSHVLTLWGNWLQIKPSRIQNKHKHGHRMFLKLANFSAKWHKGEISNFYCEMNDLFWLVQNFAKVSGTNFLGQNLATFSGTNLQQCKSWQKFWQQTCPRCMISFIIIFNLIQLYHSILLLSLILPVLSIQKNWLSNL